MSHCNMASRTKYRFPFEQYPAVRLVILFIAGMLISSHMNDGLFIVAVFTCVLLIGLITLDAHIRSALKPVLSPYLTIGVMLLVVVLGVLRFELAKSTKSENPVEVEFLSAFLDDELQWFGRIQETTLNATGTLSLWMRVDSVRFDDSLPVFNKRFNTQIRFFSRTKQEAEILIPGSYVQIFAKPSEIPQRRNPHDFDVKSWLNGQNVYIQGEGIGSPTLLKPSMWYRWGWWRYHLRQGIDTVFDDSVSALAKAIMIGYKAELEREVRQNFSRAGLAHIMAVSGMHVGFVLFPLWLILPLFWGSPQGRIAGLLLITFVLFFYAGVTGFAPSVQRASVFAFFIALSRLYKKRRDPINLTAVAALIILLIDPESLFAVGFQMSFIAVLTIFLMFPVIKQLFPSKIRYTWYSKTLQLILISICIQLALFPVLVDIFNEFSLAGPLLNTIAAPITQVMFIWGFACTALGYVFPDTATFLNIPANYLTAFLNWITNYFAGIKGTFIYITLPSSWIYLLWFSLFGFLGTLLNVALRWKWFIAVLVVLCIWQISEFRESLKPAEALITFFDVGQADAVLIQTPSGKTILYDAGLINPMSNSGTRVILPHLRAEGIRRIDAVILSHPHADHIGGIISLIENIEIGVIYDSGFQHHSAIFAGYRRAAERHSIPVVTVQAGDRIEVDPLMPVLVLSPHPSIVTTNPNEYSISVRILFGNDSLLLTGDAETQAERFLTTTYGSFLNSSILKAGHHGSRTSSHNFFLNEVNPEKVVVSNALRNRYQHPHPDASLRLHQTGARVKFTSLQGAVQFKMTGNGVHNVEWR